MRAGGVLDETLKEGGPEDLKPLYIAIKKPWFNVLNQPPE